MFELNPHGSLDAWWQHLLMVVVAAVLGYIIGYRTGKGTINILEDKLARLGVDVEKCHKSLIGARAKSAQPLINIPNLIQDLKIVEGIGPKIEKLLNDAGISSFEQLSNATPEQLKSILNAAGPRFQMHDTTTWPKQALLAHQGQWDELKKWQDELDGGSL